MSEELPGNVQAALKSGRRVEAVKLLRTKEHLDLKTAMQRIQAWERANPGEVPERKVVQVRGRHVLNLLLLVVVIYCAWQLFR